MVRNYPLDVGRLGRYNKRRRTRRRLPVTVCIAAICTWGDPPQQHIITISDRMLTAADIEFEPPQAKVYVLGTNMVALIAGDATAQAEICHLTMREVLREGKTYVAEAAEVYARQFAEYRQRQNERSVLTPLGLDYDSFIRRQRELSPDLVARIQKELTWGELEIEGIITGVDAVGAHIYVVTDPGIAVCNDTIGFGAIGIGKNHAESQLMFSRYHPGGSFEDALLLLYRAKKRAEAAPGVGHDTDIVSVSITGYAQAQPFWLDKLQEIYEHTTASDELLWASAQAQVHQFVEVLLAQQQQEGRREV